LSFGPLYQNEGKGDSQLFFGQNLMSGINFTSILTASAGAVVLLAVLRFVKR
jgi:uncharacterized membrane protein YeaQ/YmgE (transglycosylase-associated protein family)